MRSYLAIIFLSLCLCLGATAAGAQSAKADELLAEINKLETTTVIPGSEKDAFLAQLSAAKSVLTAAQDRMSQIAEFTETAANADTILDDLAQQKTAANIPEALPLETDSPDTIRSRLSVLEAERFSLSSKLSQLQTRQTSLSKRAALIADELPTAREALSDAQEQTTPKLDAEATLMQRAKKLAEQATLINRRIVVDSLQKELATVPARKPVITARIDMAQTRLARLDQTIDSFRNFLANNRFVRGELFLQQAQVDVSQAASSDQQTQAYAAANLAMAKTLIAIETQSPSIERRTARYRQEAAAVNKSAETVQRVIDTGSLSDEVGGLLRQVRSGLSKIPPLEKVLDENETARVGLELNQVLWQDQLAGLRDEAQIDDAIIPELSTGTDISAGRRFGELTDRRDDLLTALLESARIQTDSLTDQEIALQSLITKTQSVSALLDRRLLWLPTNKRLSGDTVRNLPSGVKWLLSPPSWGAAAAGIAASVLKNPFIALFLFSLPVILFLLRPALKRARTRLAARVGDVSHDQYWVTPGAIGVCVLLALPIPILLSSIGVICAFPDDLSVFTEALSTALLSTAFILLALNIFRVMSQKDGLFVQHFGWPETARADLQKNLTWFVWVQAISAFLFVFATKPGIGSLRYGVGVTAFMASSIGMAFMIWAVLKPRGGVVADVLGRPAKALYIFCPLFVISPLVIGLLPIFGYFDTAVELQSKLFASGLQVLGASIVFGLMTRFYLVAKRRAALRKAIARRATKAAARENEEKMAASGNAAPATPTKPSLEEAKKADKEVFRFLMILAIIYLIVRLWVIWSPIIPALGIADEIILWGHDTSNPLTLSRVLASFVLIVGGLLAAQNVRRFLDVSVFDRMGVETGTRFAVGTIASYVLSGIGVVIGLAHLGLDWSKLQWIVAALGVGLGFGLQEIVANFVSGVIILFERPVRVGDIVTIGSLSGTVSNIQVRATTITDFDNREVLLPNKTIITENVTNWTLRDNVTRLTIEVGVAYGSDVTQVRDLILGIAKSHIDVLPNPPATAFFLSHGESSLDYELRVFVDDPSKRLPVTHDLNVGINQTLKDHDIEIPFPQRDMNMHAPGTINVKLT